MNEKSIPLFVLDARVLFKAAGFVPNTHNKKSELEIDWFNFSKQSQKQLYNKIIIMGNILKKICQLSQIKILLWYFIERTVWTPWPEAAYKAWYNDGGLFIRIRYSGVEQEMLQIVIISLHLLFCNSQVSDTNIKIKPIFYVRMKLTSLRRELKKFLELLFYFVFIVYLKSLDDYSSR